MMMIDAAHQSSAHMDALASVHSALIGIEDGDRIAIPAVFGRVQAQGSMVAHTLVARGIRPVLIVCSYGRSADEYARDIVEIDAAALAISLGARSTAAYGAIVVCGLCEDHVARVRRLIADYDRIVVEINALPPTGYDSVLANLRFPLPSNA
jgi:hypothetical protein